MRLSIYLCLLLVALNVNCYVGEQSDIALGLPLTTGSHEVRDGENKLSDSRALRRSDYTFANPANTFTYGRQDAPNLDLKLGLPNTERSPSHARSQISRSGGGELSTPPDIRSFHSGRNLNHALPAGQGPPTPFGSTSRQLINVMAHDPGRMGIFPCHPLSTLSTDGLQYLNPKGIGAPSYVDQFPRLDRPQFYKLDTMTESASNPSMTSAPLDGFRQGTIHPSPKTVLSLAGPTLVGRKEDYIRPRPPTDSSVAGPSDLAEPSEISSSSRSSSTQSPLRERESTGHPEVKSRPVWEVWAGQVPTPPPGLHYGNPAIDFSSGNKNIRIFGVEMRPKLSLKLEKDTPIDMNPPSKQEAHLDRIDRGKNPIDREAGAHTPSPRSDATIGRSNRTRLNLVASNLQFLREIANSPGTPRPSIVSKIETDDLLQKSPMFKEISSEDANVINGGGNSALKRDAEKHPETNLQPSAKRIMGIKPHNPAELTTTIEIRPNIPPIEAPVIPKPQEQVVTAENGDH